MHGWSRALMWTHLEEAFIELASLSFALALVMLAYRPSGLGGALVGVAIAALAGSGFGWPLVERWLAAGTHPVWFALLGVVLVTGVWTHARFVLPAARDELAEPTPKAHRGWLTSIVDRFCPANLGTVGVRDPEKVSSVLVVVLLFVWLGTAPLVTALWG